MSSRQTPLGPNPTDEELQALLQEYLFGEQGSDDQQLAFEDAIDLVADAPETCWRLIDLAAKMELPIEQIAVFAAGPMEDFLGRHGGDFIDRLGGVARTQSGMRAFVACVWRGQMSDEVWGRILALRHELGINPL
jgi:hypothetical protein